MTRSLNAAIARRAREQTLSEPTEIPIYKPQHNFNMQGPIRRTETPVRFKVRYTQPAAGDAIPSGTIKEPKQAVRTTGYRSTDRTMISSPGDTDPIILSGLRRLEAETERRRLAEAEPTVYPSAQSRPPAILLDLAGEAEQTPMALGKSRTVNHDMKPEILGVVDKYELKAQTALANPRPKPIHRPDARLETPVHRKILNRIFGLREVKKISSKAPATLLSPTLKPDTSIHATESIYRYTPTHEAPDLLQATSGAKTFSFIIRNNVLTAGFQDTPNSEPEILSVVLKPEVAIKLRTKMDLTMEDMEEAIRISTVVKRESGSVRALEGRSDIVRQDAITIPMFTGKSDVVFKRATVDAARPEALDSEIYQTVDSFESRRSGQILDYKRPKQTPCISPSHIPEQ